MDADRHRKAHTLTSSRPMSPDQSLSRAASAPVDGGKHEEVTHEKIYHSLQDRRLKHKKTFDPEAALPAVYSEHPLQPARNPPKESLFDYLPFLRVFKFIVRPFRSHREPELPQSAATRSLTGKRRAPDAVDSNVPLEITLFLNSYAAFLLKNGQLQPAAATTFMNALASLQDTVTNLDRIRNTPLPFAYQFHLRLSLWLYLFFLPVSSACSAPPVESPHVPCARSSKSGPHSGILPSREPTIDPYFRRR